MRFDVLTIFPDMIMPVLGEGITGRAIDAGIIDVCVTDIREHSLDKHRKTDDYPFGGGMGMVMTPQPIYDAWMAAATAGRGAFANGAAEKDGSEAKPWTIYLSPQGKTLTQARALELSKAPWLILLCGRYEGVDERVIELVADEELSVGDYVLTGGELPAMTLVDCIARLVPGVLPSPVAYTSDSHFDGLLEHPQYTRPRVFMGLEAPAILLSGHHKNIEAWRRAQSIERTRAKRPDIPLPPPEPPQTKKSARSAAAQEYYGAQGAPACKDKHDAPPGKGESGTQPGKGEHDAPPGKDESDAPPHWAPHAASPGQARLAPTLIDDIAAACGAYQHGAVDTAGIRCLDEVRDMCEADACRMFGRSWACPPGLGGLDECERRLKSYPRALVFSVMSKLADSFDYEGMITGKRAFQDVADRIEAALAPGFSRSLMLAGAGCDACPECAYPHPCRRPGKANGALEGYGVMVSELAAQAGVRYGNGPGTVTYIGALLYSP